MFIHPDDEDSFTGAVSRAPLSVQKKLAAALSKPTDTLLRLRERLAHARRAAGIPVKHLAGEEQATGRRKMTACGLLVAPGEIAESPAGVACPQCMGLLDEGEAEF